MCSGMHKVLSILMRCAGAALLYFRSSLLYDATVSSFPLFLGWNRSHRRTTLVRPRASRGIRLAPFAKLQAAPLVFFSPCEHPLQKVTDENGWLRGNTQMSVAGLERDSAWT
jgi:hypothetical protein